MELLGLVLTLVLLVFIVRVMSSRLVPAERGTNGRPPVRGVPASTLLVLIGVVGLFQLDMLPVASEGGLAVLMALLAISLSTLAGMSRRWDGFIGWVGAGLSAFDVILIGGPGLLAGYVVVLVMAIYMYGWGRRLGGNR